MGASSVGSRGHFQFMKKTWDEMVKRMGKNWDWWTGSMDYEKSKQVADYYLNKRIPQMLDYYKIPDSIDNRLMAYNWGIGNVEKLYKMEKNVGDIKDLTERYLPQETKDYIIKYR